jgi:hypothetical protein
VQTHLLWSRYDAADRERQLDLVKAAGAGMARVDVGWASLEQDGKGRWNRWYVDKLDHVVRESEKRGIKLLLTFWETPCWASSAPASLKQGCSGSWWDRDVQRYPPLSASDYADALAWVVRRYGDRVAAWEIWNEPNHVDYFKAADRVGRYAALVKAAYPAAKAAHAGSTVLAGSLADADYEFTDALMSRGVAGHFDAWSVHPYGEDRSPLHPGIAGWREKSPISGVPRVREVMLRHGQNKPLWLTELGWSTCSIRNLAAYENCIDRSAQARYLRRAYALMQEWAYVPVGVWFNLQDTSSDPGDRVHNYGLLTEAGEAKPAFSAFRMAAEALRTSSSASGTAPDPDSAKTKRLRPRAGRGSRTLRVRTSRRRGRHAHRSRGRRAHRSRGQRSIQKRARAAAERLPLASRANATRR